MTLLSIRNFKACFYTEDGVVTAINGINLDIEEKETLGVIGETGCGKTVLGMSILHLLPDNAKLEGQILYRERNLIGLNKAEMRKIRGKEISMVFQNPLSSLNPVLRIGTQLAEPLEIHTQMKKQAVKEKVLEMLKAVKIASPSTSAKKYPHEFSGGMRQRVMLAMGFACSPCLIIADEPTTGLDVTIQAQVLQLMRESLKMSGASMLLITHDLGVAAQICDFIAVMYAGEIVEYASIKDLFQDPKHPYTCGLFESLPGKALKPMRGTCPSLIKLPDGCIFRPRCPYAQKRCTEGKPEIYTVGKKHSVRCFLYA